MIKFTRTVRLPRLTALRKAIGNTTPVAREVAESMKRELARNIILEGIWGKAWPRIAPNTVVKHKFMGKPAGLLRGLIDHIYAQHGATQATFGFKSKYAEMHHEGRDFPWTIPAKNKKILFFPVAGKIQKKGAGGVYVRAKYSVGMERVGKRKKRTKILGPSERFSMVKAKRVPHPGFQARELLPPREVIRKKTMDIVDRHIKRAV